MGGNFSLWAYLIIRMRPTFFVPFACMQSHYSDKMCKLAQLHAHWNLHVTRSHRHCAGKIMPNCIVLDSRRLYLLRIRIQWNIRQNNAPWHYWDWSFLKSAQRVVISGKGIKVWIGEYCYIASLHFLSLRVRVEGFTPRCGAALLALPYLLTALRIMDISTHCKCSLSDSP